MEYTRTIEMLDTPGVYGVPPPSISTSRQPDSKNGDLVGLRASQACIACRKQKRKCDKQLPSCSLCIRMSRDCDYSDSTPTPSADDFALLRQKVVELERKLEAKNTPWGRRSTVADVPYQHGHPACESVSTFPPIFLLDSEIFKESRMTVPKPDVQVSQKIHNTLGSIADMRDTVDRYFENIHLWLPIVSKKRMQITLENPSLDLTADLALLLLSMKLVIQGGHNNPQDAQSALYFLVKQHATVVESNGLITLQLLQSVLIITAYELGQAIYPAAYFSSGHCARLGTLMGFHDRQHAPQIMRRSGAWAEMEEIRRCWWATMLLDRYVNLGSEGSAIVTDDPPPQTVLPADDDAWDEGNMTPSEPMYVSSTTSVHAGAFARTCQATHLMGRTIRNLNDHYSDSSLRFSQAIQLHRTLTALSNVLPQETFHDSARYSTAMALCFGSLLHLCDPFSCTEANRGNHTVEETEMQAIAIPSMREVAEKVLSFSKVIREMLEENPAGVSPLVTDCLYTATATFQWLAYESGFSDALNGYNTMREILICMSNRWAVAGEYIKILDVSGTDLHLYQAHNLQVMKDCLYQGTPKF